MPLISRFKILLVIFIITLSLSTLLYFPRLSIAQKSVILAEPVTTISKSLLPIVNSSQRFVFPYVDKIIENQTTARPWLGVEGVNISPSITKVLGLKETGGFLVTTVIPSSPAEKAGLRGAEDSKLANVNGVKIKLGGDIILKIDNNNITKNDGISAYIHKAKKVGDNLNLTIFRDGQIREMNLTLGKRLDFFTYENPALGAKIQYPSDWKKEVKDVSTVDFFSPKENNSDRYLENLGIEVSSLSQSMTLDEFTSHQIDFLNQSFPNFKIIDSKVTTLAGNPAHKVVFNYGGEQQQHIPLFKIIQIWMIRDNKIYIITSGAEFNKYSKYLPIIQKMIDSFGISNFLTYENSTLGVKIQYPSDWKRAESNSNITFTSPLASNSDRYREKLELKVNSLLQNVTLDEYSSAVIKKLKESSANFRILEVATTTLAGNPAKKMVFTSGEGQNNLKVVEIWTINDDKAYSIQYSSEAQKYSKYLATIQKMVNSFEINSGQFVGLGIPGLILPPLGIPFSPSSPEQMSLSGNVTILA